MDDLVIARAEHAMRREDLRIARKHRDEAEAHFVANRSPENERAFSSAIEWADVCFGRKLSARRRLSELQPVIASSCRNCGAGAQEPCLHDGGCIDADRSES